MVGDLPRELCLREPALKQRHKVKAAGAHKAESEDRAVTVLLEPRDLVTHVVCNAGPPRLLPSTAERTIGLAALAYMRGLRFFWIPHEQPSDDGAQELLRAASTVKGFRSAQQSRSASPSRVGV